LWICNPNNPTGEWIDKDKILHLAHCVNGIISIDESFAVFKDPLAQPFASTGNRNLISIRSFSKIFGIPGIRLGYAIANKDIISKIRSVLEPFSVNTLAITYGSIVISHWKHYNKLLIKTIKLREHLEQELLHYGFNVLHSNGNWITLKFKTIKETEIFQKRLKRNGILCNNWWNFEFTYLRKEPYIRITLPRQNEYNLLIKALQKTQREYIYVKK
jgi:histidinol-phosphate/aromatic aminotransferase/cobyric acid decarboxylase-like protein